MRRPRLLEPLRHRDFALLSSGQFISLIGSFALTVALPWIVLDLTGSPLQMGIVVAIQTAVQLLLGLFGGAIVDRVPRRRVILLSDLGAAVVTTAVAVLGWLGALRIEHLYLAALFFGVSAAFFWPAMNAILPELLPAEVLQQGNALRGLSRQTARIGGPVIGGVLVAAFGPPAAFAFDGVTYFVSFALLLAVRPTPSATDVRPGIVSEIREGLSFTFSLPWLWVTIFGFAIVNAAIIGGWAVALPVLVREVLLESATALGLITAAIGAGEAVGAVLTGQLTFRRAGVAMYLFGVLSGVGFSLLGAMPDLRFVLLGAAVFGLSLTGFGVLWETALQRYVPRELLGRVTSVDWFGGSLLGPIAPLVAGDLVVRIGAPPVFVWGGVVIVAFCTAALLVPSIRALE